MLSKILKRIFYNPIVTAIIYAACMWVFRASYWLFWTYALMAVYETYQSIKYQDNGYAKVEE